MIKISEIIDKYMDYDDKYFHEAELLIIFFNSWPETQVSILKKLKLSEDEIKKIMKISYKFSKEKEKLIKKRAPINREGVILIENDVIRKMYIPKIIRIKDVEGDEYETLKKYFLDRFKGSVVLGPQKIEKLEKLLNLEGKSVDFLVFHKGKVYSYIVEIF